MKDELAGASIKKFVGLKAKMYFLFFQMIAMSAKKQRV